MSGDGQPRKRRDKRRRKEEEELYPNLKDTDQVIHVHKDAHTGGNIVTKIIFFLLMGGLVVMIGLILLEHRGTTDEDHDLSARETPWSLQFQDWSNLLTVPDIVPNLFKGENVDHNNRKRRAIEEIDDHIDELDDHISDHEDEQDDHISDHEDEKEDDQQHSDASEPSWFNLDLLGWSSSVDGEAVDTEEVDEAEVTSSWFDMSYFTGSADVTDESTHDEHYDVAESEEVEKTEPSLEQEEEEEEQHYASEEAEDEGEEELDDNRSEEEQDDNRTEEEIYDNRTEEEHDDNDTEEDEVEEVENVAKEELDEEENEDVSQVDEPISGSRHEEEEEDSSIEKLDLQEELHPTSVEEEQTTAEEEKSNEDNDEDPRGSVFPRKSSIIDEDEDESTEEVEKPIKKSGAQETSEELFPEAIEALQREAFELLKEQKEEAEREAIEAELAEEEKEAEEELPSEVVEEETEGTPEAAQTPGDVAQMSSPTVQIVPPTPPPSQMPAPLESHKPILHSVEAPIQAEDVKTASSSPSLTVPGEEYEEESEPEEEIEEEEEEEEEDLSEDAAPINPKIYEELIAKYGQPTPESSDAEASDDGTREYSDGGEVESVGEEESGGELEDSEPEEDEEEENQRWTNKDLEGVKKMVETESEGDEEEESEDEPPPLKKPVQGGAKSEDEPLSNDEEEALLRWQLQQAEEEFNYERPESALEIFRKIVEVRPNNAIALYGVARAFDRIAEIKKSNDYLQQAIEAYLSLLSLEVIDDSIFVPAAQRAINRLRFKGLHMKAVTVHKKLIDKFNDTVEYRNDLAINYLMVNRLSDAEQVFLETLKLWPDDPVARSHYGLVLKLSGKIEPSIDHLLRGLAHNHPGTKDARLYFHLGDALSRSGRSAEASKVYKDGVDKGLFRSEYQRSLYNVDHLTARPWWTLKETTYEEFFKVLELNWKLIRNEGLTAMKLKGLYQDEAENLRDVGDWKQFQLYARGSRYGENCKKTPITCKIIENFSPAKSCKRGQSKFSVMESGTHVWPHCGPTNCRLRAHLGLVVPPGPAIRVANETRKWAEGKVIVFDDSFEHEVWHKGSSLRLVLIVDVWHPDLSSAERATLSPI